jgi:hypothetical protein
MEVRVCAMLHWFMRTPAAVGLLAMLCIGARADAQTGTDFIARCQGDTRQELLRVRAAVDTIWFGDTPRLRSALNDGAQVDGAGLVHDLITRQWRNFAYACAWRVNTFQSALVVRVDSASVPRSRQ